MRLARIRRGAGEPVQVVEQFFAKAPRQRVTGKREHVAEGIQAEAAQRFARYIIQRESAERQRRDCFREPLRPINHWGIVDQAQRRRGLQCRRNAECGAVAELGQPALDAAA